MKIFPTTGLILYEKIYVKGKWVTINILLRKVIYFILLIKIGHQLLCNYVLIGIKLSSFSVVKRNVNTIKQYFEAF